MDQVFDSRPAGPTESHVRKAYALLVHACAQMEHFETARTVCHEGLERFPVDVELLFRAGLLAQHFGRPREAERFYLRLLETDEPRHFSSVDRGIRAYKARQNLAMVYAELDEPRLAEAQWRAIAADNPGYGEGWRGLVECLVSLGKVDEAQSIAERVAHSEGLEAIGLSLLADQRRESGDYDSAVQLLDQAERLTADKVGVLRSRCRLLFEANRLAEAELALKELSRREPQDPAAFHNLGAVCAQLGKRDEALYALSKSLELRPHSRATQALYEFADGQR